MAAKKRYYSVTGRIYAERDNTGRKNYVLDALGSVTGVSINGSISGAARYSPFGRTIIGSSGATLAWVGEFGYTPTGRANASHYMVDRHYDNRMGRWTTVDPLWPKEGAYLYCSSSPSSAIDQDGRQRGPAPPPVRSGPEAPPASGRGAPRSLPEPGQEGLPLYEDPEGFFHILVGIWVFLEGLYEGASDIACGLGEALAPEREKTYPYLAPRWRHARSCKEANQIIHGRPYCTGVCHRKQKCGPDIWDNPNNQLWDEHDICDEIRRRMSNSRDCYRARLEQRAVCPKPEPNPAEHQRQIDAARKTMLDCYDIFRDRRCERFYNY